jgi:hypothetical protein
MHQEERSRFVQSPDVLDGQVRDDIRGVPFGLHFVVWPLAFPLFMESRIEVLSLTREHLVIVEGRWLNVQMPFSDDSRAIPKPSQFGWQVLFLRFESDVQIENAVGLWVLPGDDRGATGSTNRVVAECVFETNALCRQLIKVWR